VDIVGAALRFELLGKPRVLPRRRGGAGWVDPADAWRRYPFPPGNAGIYVPRASAGDAMRRASGTRTGTRPPARARLAEFVESFGPMQKSVGKKLVFGLGTREKKNKANCCVQCWAKRWSSALRLLLVQDKLKLGFNTRLGNDRVAVLETNLDDVRGKFSGIFLKPRCGGRTTFFTRRSR